MKKVNYSKELLEQKVKDCYSFAELCRRLGLKPEGSNPNTVKKKLDEFGVDYSHFTGQGWKKKGHPSFEKNSIPLDKFFVKGNIQRPSKIKERLLNNGIKENKCEICGISEWLGNPITIQLHHINGDREDNRLENLIMLCPNCHSQTHNFCKRKSLINKKSAQMETSEVEPG